MKTLQYFFIVHSSLYSFELLSQFCWPFTPLSPHISSPLQYFIYLSVYNKHFPGCRAVFHSELLNLISVSYTQLFLAKNFPGSQVEGYFPSDWLIILTFMRLAMSLQTRLKPTGSSWKFWTTLSHLPVCLPPLFTSSW